MAGAAPQEKVASPLVHMSGLETRAMREISLSGVFHDGDALTITVPAKDAAGNRVSDMFDVTVAAPQPPAEEDEQ